jgi:small conductance mechanosensitive channel
MKFLNFIIFSFLNLVVFSKDVFAMQSEMPGLPVSTVTKLMDWIVEIAVKYSFQVFGGLVILFGSWVISGYLSNFVSNKLLARKVDITIIKFLAQLMKLVILVFGLLMMLSSFGVQIAPLIAGLSVAGVGIGLAVQGPLSNYAAGATLIFTKPFKVGDIIEVRGYQGEVKDISLPRTELAGLDSSRIIIPNKHIIGEIIRNYSLHRKLEINVGVSYDSDIEKVLGIITAIIKAEKRIPNNEVYKLGIKEFADSAINLQAFVWVPQDKFIDVKFAIHRAIVAEFRQNNITIPFPQRDVHVIDNKNGL